MTRLLLIRHGQSTWNALGRWQGQEDPPLTDIGRHQAALAAESIGAVDAVFSSTLERARITAEIISGSIGVGPVISLPGLVERHAGEWQGLTRDEIDESYPGFLEAGHRPPSWEADDELHTRAVTALGSIVNAIGQDHHTSAVVVTHGGVIYQLEQHLGAEFDRLSNLGARWIEILDDRWTLGERVDLLGGVEVTIPEQI